MLPLLSHTTEDNKKCQNCYFYNQNKNLLTISNSLKQENTFFHLKTFKTCTIKGIQNGTTNSKPYQLIWSMILVCKIRSPLGNKFSLIRFWLVRTAIPLLAHSEHNTWRTIGSLPLRSSNEMMPWMWRSLIIFSASGESISTQCSTFSTPLEACSEVSRPIRLSKRFPCANWAQLLRLPL